MNPMTTNAARPWHEECVLRPEVKQNTLTDDEFAADLYKVRAGGGPEVYRDPSQFFSRTYPSLSLKETVRDVFQRLNGVGGSPILRLQVAYGGGKTHRLITLLHLAERAVEVADNPIVKELLTYANVPAPQARVALLPFDKFDVHKGLEVVAPNGERRTVMTPWGALAYQLGGEAGLASILPHEENYTAPAEPQIRALLQMALDEGKSPLILLDEALNYTSEMVNYRRDRLSTLQNFFQALTQAVAATKRACLVATLLDKESVVSDLTKAQVLAALEDVFNRIQSTKQTAEQKEDIAQLLRQRLFEQVPDGEVRRAAATAMLAAYQQAPQLRPSQKDNAAFQRLVQSYPFHPDLIDVFYQKWTDLPKFQRNRGAIRLLATILRDADGNDPSLFVGVRAMLKEGSGLSAATTELARIASPDQDIWTPKLTGELARAAEAKVPALQQREIEQGVLATFLHSQPQPLQKAETPDLYAMLIHPGLDLAGLDAGLQEWRDHSWFLSEEANLWRLMTEPNLNQMLHVQVGRLESFAINTELDKQIRKVRDLIWVDQEGADKGVATHFLPSGPDQVEDDTDFHYIALGPETALELSAIPAAVTDYFTKRTGPRTYRNALVALAPQRSLLEGLRVRVEQLLGWEAVAKSDEGKRLSPMQIKSLQDRRTNLERSLPEMVRAAYGIVLDLDENGNVRAQMLKTANALNIQDNRPFPRIKKMLMDEERLIAEALMPELLLPGSHFDLWASGETSKKAADLYGIFMQLPRLPRFLSTQPFRKALREGCLEGQLILHLLRPDGTDRYYWRNPPSEDNLTLELQVLPASTATLPQLEADLLAPGSVLGLWPEGNLMLLRRDVAAYFNGTQAPKVTDNALLAAIREAVQRGLLAARTSGRTYYKEVLPDAVVSDSLELRGPLLPVAPADLMPEVLPGVWEMDATPPRANLAEVANALVVQRGEEVPWSLVTEAVNAGLRARRFTSEGIWPCEQDEAGSVMLLVCEAASSSGGTAPVVNDDGASYATGGSVSGASGTGGSFGSATDEQILSVFELQRLGEIVDQLTAVNPLLKIGFKVMVTAEGREVDETTREALNAVLSQATKKLRFE